MISIGVRQLYTEHACDFGDIEAAMALLEYMSEEMAAVKNAQVRRTLPNEHSEIGLLCMAALS